ncbi:MAG: hypothetical protein OXE75_06650 [bacterium]|nr:hypothetical protein [bacterium]
MSNVLVKRVIGAYLALVAVVVLAQFVAWPLYVDDHADAANDTWLILNWFMAAGLALMLVITTRAKRSCDAEGGDDDRQWIRANVMFYLTVLLAVAFVPNWFAAAWGENANGTVWHVIDTVLPVLFGVQARRLLRPVSG